MLMAFAPTFAALAVAVGGPDSTTTSNVEPKNVLGEALQVCSRSPMTGWFRDGRCRTDDRDRGIHVVCARVTQAFLEFSRSRGNDLIRPSPDHRFPGLKPGDQWCVCAARWREADEAGVAPPVVLDATHEKAVRIVPRKRLEAAQATGDDEPDATVPASGP